MCIPNHIVVCSCMYAIWRRSFWLWADNNRIWYTHWERKYLNWYTPFWCESQCIGGSASQKKPRLLYKLNYINPTCTVINFTTLSCSSSLITPLACCQATHVTTDTKSLVNNHHSQTLINNLLEMDIISGLGYFFLRVWSPHILCTL